MNLSSARIVLLFMSPHFIESRYCYEVEGRAALQRHNAGEARVVPVILRPCAWEKTPFGSLQALPTDAKPVSRWSDRDEACLNVARGVMKIVDELIDVPKEPPEISLYKTLSEPSRLVYCRRCGKQAGTQSTCVGVYTHHDFRPGGTLDYCARCGERPGVTTTCTGIYTEHNFVNNSSGTVICSRCGVAAGSRTVCTGIYTDHKFIAL
jgi:hypothetical protein